MYIYIFQIITSAAFSSWPLFFLPLQKFLFIAASSWSADQNVERTKQLIVRSQRHEAPPTAPPTQTWTSQWEYYTQQQTRVLLNPLGNRVSRVGAGRDELSAGTQRDGNRFLIRKLGWGGRELHWPRISSQGSCWRTMKICRQQPLTCQPDVFNQWIKL